MAVIRAAMANFRRFGYEGAQMAEIATEAGVTKATLYRRYEGKSHILAAATDAAGVFLLSKVKEACESVPDPFDALQRVLSTALEHCLAEGLLSLNHLILSVPLDDLLVREQLATWRLKFDGFVEELVAKCLEQVRRAPGDSAVIASAAIDLVLNGPIIRALNLVDARQNMKVEARAIFAARWPMVVALIHSQPSA